MSVNLDAAVEIAKQRAKLYTEKRSLGRSPETVAAIYNAHLDGLLECLGERESLRQIVARLEKAEEGAKSLPPTPDDADLL